MKRLARLDNSPGVTELQVQACPVFRNMPIGRGCTGLRDSGGRGGECLGANEVALSPRIACSISELVSAMLLHAWRRRDVTLGRSSTQSRQNSGAPA